MVVVLDVVATIAIVAVMDFIAVIAVIAIVNVVAVRAIVIIIASKPSGFYRADSLRQISLGKIVFGKEIKACNLDHRRSLSYHALST